MSDTTKILTVSYGTFSCTLEGFDDPLGSMRDIAEYFRDLASDDRYFGAEPPTPDVEMLQRIAEKEVQRRVEARVSDAGVALVAAAPDIADTPEPVTEPAPVAAPEPVRDTRSEPSTTEAPARAQTTPPDAAADAPAGETRGPLTYDDEFTMSDEPEDVLAVDPNATLDTAGPAETVAEKLRRIRAVVSRNVEVDQEAVRQQQSPNADDPDLRSRAQTLTLDQISADIADDIAEDVADDIAEDVANDLVADTPARAENANTASEPVETTDRSVTNAADDDPAPHSDESWEFEPELLGDDSDAYDDGDASDGDNRPISQRTDSRVVSDVLDKIGGLASDDTAKPGKDRVTTRTLAPEPEKDVGRLLDETDSKLNDNETVRRRRVISQMRAAVAATKADRLVTEPVSKEAVEEEEQNPYRADLTQAVPADMPAKTNRRRSSPPLVLVSSQRVNEPVDVAMPSEPASDAISLADYAADIGTNELSELMEAAAAYAVFSEGQPSFTRPEIMKMVSQMDPSLQLTREESLRSFGQLLRQGTFKKLERGQFTIDQQTKYNPALRAAHT